MARLFARDRKPAAGERIVDALREGALANDGELSRCRERAADEWAENEGQRCVGSDRFDRRAAFAQQQPRSQAAAAQKAAQNVAFKRHGKRIAARRINAQIATVIAAGNRAVGTSLHGYQFFSREQVCSRLLG